MAGVSLERLKRDGVRRGIVIQARLKSTRYPKKILAPLAGRTVLENVYSRCRRSVLAGESAVVACPTDDSEEIFTTTGIVPYEGPEEDLLTRFLIPVRRLGFDVVARVTADCPLVCPDMLDIMFGNLGNADGIVNWKIRCWPDGADIDIWSRNLLEEIDGRLKTPKEREWWASIVAHSDRYDVIQVTNMNGDWSRYRLTLDYPADMEVIKRVYAAQGNECWDWPMIVHCLKKHPEWRKFNKDHVGNFGDIV